MNPALNILPTMSTNECARRIGAVFLDENGNPKTGAPGGPIPTIKLPFVTRNNAAGPLPTPAALIIAANPKRTGIVIKNEDSTNQIWYAGDPAVTDLTGFPLDPLGVQAIIYNGPIYAYCTAGTPSVLIQETQMS